MRRLLRSPFPEIGAVTLLLAQSCTETPGEPHRAGPTRSTTAPAEVVLAGAGDIARCDGQDDEATAALLDGIPGTVITLGDNVYGSSTVSPDFNCYDRSWGRHKARTRPAVGHMEYWSPGAATYWQYFGATAGDSGKGYYSYDLGGWHIVVLNSGIDMSAGSAQEQWLAADLAGNAALCTLAYWHVPRFSTVPNPDGLRVLPALKPLWDDLYAAGAELVVNAHYEVYERFAPQTPDGAADPRRGIREFIVGTGGMGLNTFTLAPLANSEVRNSGAPGVLQLTLRDGGYSWQFIPVAGKTFSDSGQATCHGAGAPRPVESVDVSPSSGSVEVGATLQFTATARDASGQQVDAEPATWTSSDTTVARVNAKGVVTGWTPGTATISATMEGKSGTASVTVVPTSAAVLVGAGDIADCTSIYDEATAELLDEIPGTVFTAGDNAYPDGTPDQYTNCYGPTWGRHKARTRPVAGNHDYATAGAAGYFGYFGAAAGDRATGYYSYDLGSWHIVALNNYQPMAPGTDQEQWLRADLAASSKQCTLAIWHEPLFTSGVSGGGAIGTRALWQALYEAGAEVVVVGHDHDYERFAPQTSGGSVDAAYGIREFVVGTGGAGLMDFVTVAPHSEVRNNSAHGVLKLTLRDSGYEWRFIPDAGQTFSDAGSAPCHGPPGDRPPTPSFSESCAGLTCDFTDASTDPDGRVVAWSWNFGDGSTSTNENTSHTYAAPGRYNVWLTVTDDKGATGSTLQSVTVTAENQAPTAAFNARCTGLACNFTDESSDPDGLVVAWSWTFGDGATSNSQHPSHTYSAAGTYSVLLTVTDNKGATGSRSQSVTVTATNQSPTAAFTSGCTGLSCSFTDASSDPDGRVVAWSWSFGDGGGSSSQSPSHTYGAGGTYTVRLTVTDDDGATGSTTQSVTVTAPNQPPRASFSASCSGLSCSFSDASSDPDGRVVAWSWSFGDGGGSSSQSPSHTYGAGGTYTVRLTVTDDHGATGSTTQSVTVTAPNQPPTVRAGSDVTMLPGLFNLQATFSDPDDDGPWTYTISWGDGLSSSGQTSDQSSRITGTHPYLVPGQYRVRVSVTDEHGATGADELIVTVKVL
ncbi:MAG TPA: PKD domain-containing protein [Gemmatimonadales bacterium]